MQWSFRFWCCLIALSVAGCQSGMSMKRNCVPRLLAQAPMIDLSRSPTESRLPRGGFLAAAKRPAPCEIRRVEHTEESTRQLNVLAMSGGGIYGAFDVGVLKGWSESGSRPTFDVVTGISTGALIATFAFLGPEYDDFLRDAYVNITSDDIYHTRPLLKLLRADSFASSAPLQRKIMDAITPAVLGQVAYAHSQGRRLYIGTTNLDTRRLVIWDMGAIASQGTPEALRLYQKIVLASASVPGFFPPVNIEVEVNGQRFREVHVDGGTTAAVFLRPYMMQLTEDAPKARAGSKIFVISSGKLFADPECVQPRLVGISSSAIATLLYAGTRGDIYRIHDLALATGSEFKLIAVPQDFEMNPNSLNVDRANMKRLFDVGRHIGSTGQAWLDAPPDLDGGDLGPPRAGVRFSVPINESPR